MGVVKVKEAEWPSSVKVGVEEGWSTFPDGLRFFWKTWKAQDTPRAKVIAIHGFSDHCNTYNDLFSILASRGIEVYAFDQRGWGRTADKPALRGASGPTTQVLADIEYFAKMRLPEDGTRPTIPTFLFGHSMGGQEAIHAAQSLPSTIRSQLRGYIIFSPFCGLHASTTPSAFTVIAGRLAAMAMPKFHMHQPLNEEFLTRDKTAARRFAEDILCHDYGTLEGLAGMLDRAEDIGKGNVKISDDVRPAGEQAIWVAHGREDHVCDCAATEKWYNESCGLKDKKLRIWEEAYHRLNDELEPTKTEFVTELGDWILEKAASGP